MRAQAIRRTTLLFAAPLAAIALLLGPALTDPGLFGDDLKWLGGTHNYITNLEREARWLVHAWNTLLGLPPPALAVQLCLVLWVATAAITAEALAPPRATMPALALAFALAANPGALSFLMWPLTTLPALAVLAAGTLAVRVAPRRAGLLCVPWLALMALSHQLLALVAAGCALLVVLGLAAREAMPAAALARRLAAVLAGAGAGIALGTLAGFAGNWWAFGHFGLLPDPWRAELLPGAPARGFEAALAAAAYALRQLQAPLHGLFPWFAAAALLLGGAVLARPAEAGPRAAAALRLGAGLGIGGVALAFPFATALPLPELRGTMTIWLGAVALAGLATWQGALRWPAAALLAAMVLAALPPAGAALARFSAEAAHNRAAMQGIVAALRARLETAPETIVLHGAPRLFTGLAGRPEYDWWVYYMLEYQAARAFGRRLPVAYCVAACREGRVLPPGRAGEGPVFPDPGAFALQDGVAYLRIGP